MSLPSDKTGKGSPFVLRDQNHETVWQFIKGWAFFAAVIEVFGLGLFVLVDKEGFSALGEYEKVGILIGIWVFLIVTGLFVMLLSRRRCASCGAKLVNGECPNERCAAHRSLRIQHAGKQEFCPMCGCLLVDGECPQGHTIVRCPKCNSIFQDGACPNCPHVALVNSWLTELGAYALEVVASPNDECGSYTLRVPNSFVIGNGPNGAKEPFVELCSSDNAKRFCQYVRMELTPDGEAFIATLLISSFKPVFVDGRKIANAGDTATLSLGGCIQLYPGYVLELVAAPQEVDESSTPTSFDESTNGDVLHSTSDSPSTIRPLDPPIA